MIDKDKARELAQYFKKTPDDIVKDFKLIKNSPSPILWVAKSNADWASQKIDQRSKKQVENWFKHTTSYIFELMEVQSMPKRKKLNRQIFNFCQKNKLEKILDFGCGVGQNAIEAVQAGFNTTMADLPGKTLGFAIWRAQKRHLNIKVIRLKNNKSLKGKYDAIICLEVFQHLTSPITTAKNLFNHLKKCGYLLVTTRFYNPSYLMALKKNYPLEKTFSTELEKIGFILKDKIYQWGKGQKAKYLYVYQKP